MLNYSIKRKTMMQIFLLPFFFLFLTSNVFAQLAGQLPLAPNRIPQFVDPLPHFAGARVDAKACGSLTVTAKPTQQIAVSTGTVLAGGIVGPQNPTVGLADLWAYAIQYGSVTKPAYWPAFTIEAQQGVPLNVTYVNGLGGQTYSNVGLIVDKTLHWAGMMIRPDAPPYTGEPPITVHLHGGEVPPLSVGGPDSWFTPGNVVKGHAFNPNPWHRA